MRRLGRLHKLRRVMARTGRDLLTGKVEADGCYSCDYVGGIEERLPGRLDLEKALIVVAVQEDGLVNLRIATHGRPSVH